MSIIEKKGDVTNKEGTSFIRQNGLGSFSIDSVGDRRDSVFSKLFQIDHAGRTNFKDDYRVTTSPSQISHVPVTTLRYMGRFIILENFDGFFSCKIIDAY